MKKEFLFRALGEVGDDLIHMAEHRKFANHWKKWASLAACLVLVVSLSILVLPYFPMGCGSSMKEEAPAATESAAPEAPAAEEEKAEAPAEEAPAEEEAVEEEAPAEAVPDTEAGVTDEAQSEAATRLTVRSTIYYLRDDVVIRGEKPGNVGQYIGDVSDSDDESLIGCPVYEVMYTTWYSNFAVDGQSVPAEIYVEGPGGWIFGETYNEKTVSRYTAADVQNAIDTGDTQWIIDTFVKPVEMYGPIRFLDSSYLEEDELIQLFLASTHMNTGMQVRTWQMRDHGWRIPFKDLKWRLSRFLDDVTFEPEQLGEDQLFWENGEPIAVFIWQDDTEPLPADGLYLKTAGLEDDLLYLRVGLPETDDLYDEVHYTIRFYEDSWRYESIQTPG